MSQHCQKLEISIWLIAYSFGRQINITIFHIGLDVMTKSRSKIIFAYQLSSYFDSEVSHQWIVIIANYYFETNDIRDV